jgi:ATP-dependent metalloprotease FtsH
VPGADDPMNTIAPLDAVLSVAAGETVAAGSSEITLGHLLIALSKVSELNGSTHEAAIAAPARQEFELMGVNPRRFRRRLRELLGRREPLPENSRVNISVTSKAVIAHAEGLAQVAGVPLDASFLVRAAFMAWTQAERSGKRPDSPMPPLDPVSLGELTRRLRALRQELLARVYGQQHAIHEFVEGLFSVEVTRGVDTVRRGPAGVFVFAGPPGVGKTYLSELGAQYLQRPFKRFDMSSYGHGLEGTTLAGAPRVYQGAQPGALTDFVHKNPTAILLFDEIEKAHPTTINLFLQLLDAGRLQDKFTEQEVEFRDTVVVFTTNVGRRLYEDENHAGIRQTNSAFHRNSVLDALRTEINPLTREPFFPAAICSRIATGHPILFNHLRVDDLVQVARKEVDRVAMLLASRHQQQYTVASEIPIALVMREGARTDARTIKARAEAFLKEELFKACQLFADERVDAALATIRQLVVEIDEEYAGEFAQRLFRERQQPAVLLIGDLLVGQFYSEILPEVEWITAASGDAAFALLGKSSPDFVLLDLAIQERPQKAYGSVSEAFHDVSAPVGARRTELHFDYRPLAAARFASGQRILEQLHARMPDIPVYLLSRQDAGTGLGQTGVDEELLLACVRAGGARGAIREPPPAAAVQHWEELKATLQDQIETVARRLRMERTAAEFARQNQVLTFDMAPAVTEGGTRLQIRCRNFRLTRAVKSTDAGAMLSEVERPTTCFDDVFGAAAAKGALSFIQNWLREPKKYAAAGVEAPRGVLLTGPPGTGKTMLARALAGESDSAFLVEAATNFVTKYQGSGPESIRGLFARARRYAPSIVFIDEIDAIGTNRADVTPGLAGHGEALALNQLLTEMDGFSKSTSCPVVVIAATNHPEKLDPALLRRFSRVIEVELPTRGEREQYLRARLLARGGCEVSDSTLARIGAQSQGMSIADLERVLAEASVMALANDGSINDAILGEAFEKVTMGEAKAGADPVRTARHEAGHALVMCALGDPPVYTTIVGRGNFGGYAAFDDKGERRSQTKLDLENLICQLLAGREAERLYYGDGEGDSTGPSNDLERATNVAEAMVYELGMSAEVGFVRVDRRRPLGGDLSYRCHVAVREIIDAQATRARCVLVDRRGVLDRIVEQLLDRSRLLKHELLAIVGTSDQTDRTEDLAR